jgi:hypothetical protein
MSAMKRMVLVVVLAAFASAASAFAAPSPKALYNALLATPLSGTTPTPSRPGSTSRRHHVVGEILVNFSGGRTRIAYVVFPNHADALGNYRDGVSVLKRIGAVRKIKKPVPGLPRPSILVDAFQSRIGVTQITFLSGNVEIAAQSVRTNAKSGNEKLAKSLAQLALRHLRTVEKTA